MLTRTLVIIAAVLVIGLIVAAAIFIGKPADKDTVGTASPSPSSSPAASGSDQLQSTDETVGTGATAQEGSTITVKYTGMLADGTVFDSTDKHGGQPATFTLAKGQLIDGWVQGIPGMKVGGKRKLVIPPALGYGAAGNGSIPPNSTLTFEIELLDVK